MPVPDEYKGREPSLIKHLILENYLRKLAYHSAFKFPNFSYIDGFSGPWESQDNSYKDTSFGVALNILRSVRIETHKYGKTPQFKCLFIEKKKKSFQKLKAAIDKIEDIQCTPRHGEFENYIREIINFIGTSFSFIFIDPKGWKDYPLDKISPLLKHEPGEVLVNFMYDFLNRALDSPDKKIQAALNIQLGGKDWPERMDQFMSKGCSREYAVMKLFCGSLKQYGNFKYVVSTPIERSTIDRTLYHLCYATRHIKGLEVFREVERDALKKQIVVHEESKLEKREQGTNQLELRLVTEAESEADVLWWVDKEIESALLFLKSLLDEKGTLSYRDARGLILEEFRLLNTEINKMVWEARRNSQITIKGIVKYQKVPKDNNLLTLSK